MPPRLIQTQTSYWYSQTLILLQHSRQKVSWIVTYILSGTTVRQVKLLPVCVNTTSSNLVLYTENWKIFCSIHFTQQQ